MRILVTGGSGLVGSYCVSQLLTLGHHVFSPSFEELDITIPQQISDFIEINTPDIILHCAAYTDVSKAEEERNNKDGAVWQINVKATKHLIDVCQQKNIYFCHISTDMVFAGRKDHPGPYLENSPRETNYDTLSWYGASKSEAEKVVTSYPLHAIIRISNPVRSHYTIKQDFLHKIMTTIEQKEKPKFFSDQTLTVTYIPDIVETIRVLINQKKQGVFHVSSPHITSPFEYATVLQKTYSLQSNKAIQNSSLTDFIKSTGQMTRYIQFGGLSVEQTQKTLNVSFTSWQDSLQKIYSEEK